MLSKPNDSTHAVVLEFIRPTKFTDGLNFNTRRDEIGASSPVLGLRPVRGFLSRTTKEPKDESKTFSPRSRQSVISLRTCLTIEVASTRDSWTSRQTASIKSSRVLVLRRIQFVASESDVDSLTQQGKIAQWQVHAGGNATGVRLYRSNRLCCSRADPNRLLGFLIPIARPETCVSHSSGALTLRRGLLVFAEGFTFGFLRRIVAQRGTPHWQKARIFRALLRHQTNKGVAPSRHLARTNARDWRVNLRPFREAFSAQISQISLYVFISFCRN